MKILNNITACILASSLLFACDPSDGDKVKIGSAPTADDIIYTAKISESNPNTVDFNFENQKATPYWIITSQTGTKITSTDRSFSESFVWAGDYQATIQMYDKGGLSEPKSFTINIAQTDPGVCTDAKNVALTGGCNTQKIWVWDSATPGHLGCGDSSSNGPDWYSTAANEKEGTGLYDDELIFELSAQSTFTLLAHDSILVNESAAKTMDPINYPNGATVNVTVAYKQPEGQTWSFVSSGGKEYIQFSDKAFPSYVGNPDALGGRYEILELTEKTLYLRWANNDIAWYYRFKAKD